MQTLWWSRTTLVRRSTRGCGDGRQRVAWGPDRRTCGLTARWRPRQRRNCGRTSAPALPLSSGTRVPTAGPALGAPGTRRRARSLSGAPLGRPPALRAAPRWPPAAAGPEPAIGRPPHRLTQKFVLNSEPVMAGASAGAEESGVAAARAGKPSSPGGGPAAQLRSCAAGLEVRPRVLNHAPLRRPRGCAPPPSRRGQGVPTAAHAPEPI